MSFHHPVPFRPGFRGPCGHGGYGRQWGGPRPYYNHRPEFIRYGGPTTVINEAPQQNNDGLFLFAGLLGGGVLGYALGKNSNKPEAQQQQQPGTTA